MYCILITIFCKLKFNNTRQVQSQKIFLKLTKNEKRLNLNKVILLIISVSLSIEEYLNLISMIVIYLFSVKLARAENDSPHLVSVLDDDWFWQIPEDGDREGSAE